MATAHLQQTGKNINIVPTGQLTGSHPVVSGPAPPPPPPPPSNQQNKSVLRKSQRTSATVSGATNQSLNNQHSTGKDGNKVSHVNGLKMFQVPYIYFLHTKAVMWHLYH